MQKIISERSSKDAKGFALAYVLIIIGASIIIGGILLISSLTDNRQANIHARNISSFYTAESGAQVAQLAFKRYIEQVNAKVIDSYTWNNLRQVKSYIDLLKHGSLGKPSTSNKAVFHLNLDAQNNFYLVYSNKPIVNELENNSSLETSITLTPLGSPSSPENSADIFSFPFQYTIVSKGHYHGSVTNESTVIGEGTASINFSTGSFARYALFMDVNCAPNNCYGWFTDLVDFAGPVFTNDIFCFEKKPKFRDLVSSKDRYAMFCNNGCPVKRDADRNQNIDVPLFEKGFLRNVPAEPMPTNLNDLRQAVLKDNVNNPPRNNAYFFPKDARGNLTGGLYLPRHTSLKLIVQGNKQIVQAINNSGYYPGISPTTNVLNFEFDYATKTTTVKNPNNNRVIETNNSLPNGSIFVEGIISSLEGTVYKDARLSIGSLGNITITNHLKYQEDPLKNPQAKNILAIMSETGNIIIPTTTPTNLMVSATLFIPKGSFQTLNICNTGDKGTLTVLGGVIQKYFGYLGQPNYCTNRVCAYRQLVIYDKRAADIDKAPPGLPKSSSLVWNSLRPDSTDTLDLIVWKNKP